MHSYNRSLPSKPHYPVYMSQQTFFRMVYTPDGHLWSKLESFLAASLLVKHFARAASESADPNNPNVRALTSEPDTYRIENLCLQIAFVFDPSTSIYRLQLTSLFDAASQLPTNFMWQQDELNLLETFLNDALFPVVNTTNQIMMPSIDMLPLAAAPGRPTVIGVLEKMLSIIQPKVLRDLIKVIRLEQVCVRPSLIPFAFSTIFSLESRQFASMACSMVSDESSRSERWSSGSHSDPHWQRPLWIHG